MDTIFEATHKVRGYECDFYGHANNATYLNYLEYARGELLTAAGLSLPKLKAAGISIVIREIRITYRYPAKINEVLKILSSVARHGNASCTFLQQIIREADGHPIADAEVTWAIINERGRPVRIPPIIREALGF